MDAINLALPYLIPVALVGTATFIKERPLRVTKDGKKYYAVFSLLVLFVFLFAALRGNGNGDYFIYLRRGARIKKWGDIFNNTIPMEVGYCVLAWIVNQLHWPAQAVIALMNAISICCIAHTVKKYSPNPKLSLLVFLPFFFQYDMHAARTAVAISVFTLSIPYILERKFLKFCAVTVVSILFHKEAAICVAAYFVPRVHINKKLGMALLLIGMAGALLKIYDPLILRVLNILPFKSLQSKFIGYMNNARFGYPARLYDPRLWIVIALFLIARYRMPDESLKERAYRNFLINSCYMTAVIMIVFNAHTIMVYRLSSFYNIFTILLVPQIIEDTKTRRCGFIGPGNRREWCLGITLAYIGLACVYAFNVTSTYRFFELMYWT